MERLRFVFYLLLLVLKMDIFKAVPPSIPVITDELGRELSDVTNPYDEDSPMTLTCITYGGRPKPTVRWWRGEMLIESRTISTDENMTSTSITITRLNRGHYKAVYTCQAINNNITVPKQKSITVNMYLKPLKVYILNKSQQLSAGRSYGIECQSVGSVPPANITWRRNNEQLRSTLSSVLATDANVSASVLTFVPRMEDHDKTLTCIASHPIKQWKEETSWVLDVYYAPEVNLSLGSQLNPKDIEEGDDVYFNCRIHSNPTAYKVVWKHNGNYVHQNVKNEILANDKSLVLRNITRKWNGNFTCTASNVEGDKDSNVVELRVLYKPICKQNQKSVYGAARNEDIQVICEVDADPEPDNFLWAFNHSREPISDKRYNTINKRRDISILTFTPVTDMDFGYLLCWATNRLGKQASPCIYHIIPASVPHPPNNCTIDNVTTVSLEVNCLEGFDGGLSQHFVLEVINYTSGNVLINLTAGHPNFKLNRLSPGNSIKLNILAQNAKGKSIPFVLESATLKTEKQTGNPNSLELTPVIGIMVCISIFVIMGVVIIVCILKCGTASIRRTSKRPTTLLIKDKSVPSRTALVENQDKDEKNPDLIPTGKNAGYQLLRTDSQILAETIETNKPGVNLETRRSRNFENLVPVIESCSPIISPTTSHASISNNKHQNKISTDYNTDDLKSDNNS